MINGRRGSLGCRNQCFPLMASALYLQVVGVLSLVGRYWQRFVIFRLIRCGCKLARPDIVRMKRLALPVVAAGHCLAIDAAQVDTGSALIIGH